jgi:glutamate-1-semialdehyde 2,1-aminomutase
MRAQATTRTLTKSNAQFKKAVQRLPLGVASNFRYWGEDRTIYVKDGKGARIRDIDGNGYIDYRLGYGPAILGYADDHVDAAAMEGIKVGGVFALATEREFTVAERIAKMVPAAERVRFSNSGTEAVMAGLRLARAYSGRDSYVVVEGGYHGLFDAALWYASVDDWEPGQGDPELVPYSQGVPQMLRRLIHTVPLNDANRLEDTLKKHHDEIGCLLIEAILGNCCSINANQQYVQDVRQLCDKYDVVMLMDEVKTGFRVAKGGAQSLYGVTPDLCTFAKAVANGYPISVLAGRAEIMGKIGKGVAHGGTYTAHSVSLAAAEETLRILDETTALADIASYGTAMQAGITRILDARDIPHSFVGHPSMGGLFFDATPPQNYRDWKTSDYTFYDTMAPFLHDLGILCEPDSREPWFVSAAHDQACLDETLAAFEKAVDLTQEKLQDQRISA